MTYKSFLLLTGLLTGACSGSSTAPSPSPTPAPIVQPAPSVPAPAPLPTRGPDFNLAFWNEFVHNGFDAPPGSEPLRRLTAAPMLALMTVDDAGQLIDDATLASTESALREVASQWTGGLFGLAGVQRVTQSQQGQHGWLTVKWANAPSAFCGFSDIGVDGGVMTLYPNTPNCRCPGSVTTSRIRLRTVRHELGHAFGYYHTDSDGDLMKAGVAGCDAMPSAREVAHAVYAYQTPVGSTSALPHSPLVILD